ncbi:ribonuclease III [Microgenomates group bacterium]|nr:ribonuclease III [Microgenomates group bacterium]
MRAPKITLSDVSSKLPFPEFKNKNLLLTALSHRSALHEHLTPSKESNERLEFLGDAILEFLITDFLYHRLPHEPEGKLTLIRSALVKTTTLAQIGHELNMGERLFMSKGEEKTNGRNNESLLANSFEALLGALYLDQGIDAVTALLKRTLIPVFDEIMRTHSYRDHKSHLQEIVQARGLAIPVYEVVSSIGPDHDKTFTIQAVIDGEVQGEGAGKSKQQAQQAAAAQALEHYH